MIQSKKKFSILIVDDTPANLQVLGNVLREEGYVVDFALSGKLALDRLEKKHFDLMLLDIMMPEMDGHEVCSTVRSKSEYDNLPIIFLTANNDEECIIKAFDLGGQDYVVKPFNARELLKRVNTQIELYWNKKQLIKLNKDLEKKVEHRTKKLKEANEKLLKLDEAKLNFLKMISHEIRTPLNGIAGSIRILREENRDESLVELYDVLNASVYRLEDFSDIALHITMLEIGQYSLQYELIQVSGLITNNYLKILEKYKNKEIKFTSNFVNSDFTIYADKKLVNLALYKLLDNAFKYSNKSGNVEVNISREKESLLIKIEDNGIGFPKEISTYIFKPFSTASMHVNNNLGLDLYFSKLVMDAHQGKIEGYNNEKGGVTIILHFS